MEESERVDDPLVASWLRSLVVSVPMELFYGVRETATNTTRSYTDLVIGSLVQHEEALIRDATERAAQEVAHSPLAACGAVAAAGRPIRASGCSSPSI